MTVSSKFGSEAWKWYEGLVSEEVYAVLQTPEDNFNNYIKNVIFGKQCPVYLPPQRPTDFPQHRSHRRDICILNHDKISSHSALSGEYNPLIST